MESYCTKLVLSQIFWALDGPSYPKQLWSLRYYMWPKTDMGKICPAWLGNICSKALLRNQFRRPNFYFCWFFKKYKNNQSYDMPKLTLWYQATKSWILGCQALVAPQKYQRDAWCCGQNLPSLARNRVKEIFDNPRKFAVLEEFQVLF